MEFGELVEFAKKEHDRLVTHHNTANNPRTRYTMLAKLMEEVGELSEAILKNDNLQRKDKEKIMGSVNHELADVILCSLVLADELGVDIENALKEKIEKIKTRKY
ncbi:MAG: MazG nucleotide pyrophosphohydrolase domain-containing protein [archaeon]